VKKIAEFFRFNLFLNFAFVTSHFRESPPSPAITDHHRIMNTLPPLARDVIYGWPLLLVFNFNNKFTLSTLSNYSLFI
jgi:hypothetical protein